MRVLTLALRLSRWRRGCQCELPSPRGPPCTAGGWGGKVPGSQGFFVPAPSHLLSEGAESGRRGQWNAHEEVHCDGTQGLLSGRAQPRGVAWPLSPGGPWAWETSLREWGAALRGHGEGGEAVTEAFPRRALSRFLCRSLQLEHTPVYLWVFQ